MERVIDSACVLSLSVGTLPVKVTTFFSRSWLTATSLSPAVSSACRTFVVTSGALGGLEAHAEIIASTRLRNKTEVSLFVFITLLEFSAHLNNVPLQRGNLYPMEAVG